MRGSHRSVQGLEDAIREFITIHNLQPKPFHGPNPPIGLDCTLRNRLPPWLLKHPTRIQEINDSGD
jgi:hypothetical protein